jgi:hypothetical protein
VSVEITIPHACSFPEPLAMRPKRSAGTHQPRDRGGDGDQGAGPARQLPDGDLPSHFESDSEEEDPHQRVVHERVQGEIQPQIADADHQMGLPERVIRRQGPFGPDDRRKRPHEKEQGADPVLSHRADPPGDRWRRRKRSAPRSRPSEVWMTVRFVT